MANPIIVNSANVIQFGFTTTIDLDQKQVIFDISSLTQFVTGNAGNIQGIFFELFDASGLQIATPDFSVSDIDPVNPQPFVVQLPNGFAQYGLFVIRGILIDQDGTRTTIELKKEICEPQGVKDGSVDGLLSEDVNCQSGTVSISEKTKLVYAGKSPSSVTKNGTFYYPQGTINSVPFTYTPFILNQLYTGSYVVKNKTIATYDLLDGVYVKVSYVSNLKFDVTCQSKLVDLLCCITDEQSIALSDPNSARGREAQSRLNKISTVFLTASVKELAGQDAGKEVKIIQDVLRCDCDCNNLIEPKVIGGGGSASFSIIGGGNTSVTSAVVGDDTQYTVFSKSSTVTKDPSDLAFNIQVINTSANVEYKITFNYPVLANSILTAIDNDPQLTAYLQEIVGATASGISLAGLDGGCVIDIGTDCSYTLIEAATSNKNITGILIDGTTYNAPTALAISNTSGISAFLNSLSKGTFTVTLVSGSVTIQSNSNPHVIGQLFLTLSGSPLTRQFTRTCVGLVQVLQAIIDYVCDLNSTQVKFGVAGKTLCTYDNGGNVVMTPVPEAVDLGTLISEILAAQCQLFNSVSTAGVTCASIKAVFTTSATAFATTDSLLGTKGAACATVPLSEVATAMLSLIGTNNTLKTAFCALVASCSAPTCAPVTNASFTLTTGPTCVQVTNITGSAS